MVTELPPLEPVPAVLGENDAAVVDAFVVPSYLRLYWEAAKRVLLVGEAARVVHLGARTGFPDSELLEHMPNTVMVSVEESAACLTLARSKLGAMGVQYVQADPLLSGLPGGTFSHALALHPVAGSAERRALFAELGRLLYAGGQAVITLPLSSSFPEVLDLLAEYALKHDVADLSRALQVATADRVTVETLSEEAEDAGLSDVDFELIHDALGYDSGRALLEDPAARYLIVPQIAHWLESPNLATGMDYVARAIDKYWSEERMDLSVTVAAISARR